MHRTHHIAREEEHSNSLCALGNLKSLGELSKALPRGVRVLVALAVVQRHERGLAPARGGQDVLRPERVGGRVRRGLLEDVADARGENNHSIRTRTTGPIASIASCSI